jgi:hypothetical protein
VPWWRTTCWSAPCPVAASPSRSSRSSTPRAGPERRGVGVNLKGDGFHKNTRAFADQYIDGIDDESIEATLHMLRDLKAEVIRRTKVFKNLPPSINPDGKTNPAIAKPSARSACRSCSRRSTSARTCSRTSSTATRPGAGRVHHQGRPLPRRDPAARHPAPGQGLAADRGVGEHLDPVLPARDGPDRERHDPGHLGVQERDPRDAVHQGHRASATWSARARSRRSCGPTSSTSTTPPPSPPRPGRCARPPAPWWSETVTAALAELRPEVYGGWKPEQLTAALKPYGIATGQVWSTDPATGKGANRRGVIREEIAETVAERNRKRSV